MSFIPHEISLARRWNQGIPFISGNPMRIPPKRVTILLPVLLLGVWFDKTMSHLLRRRSCSSVAQATFVSSRINYRRGVFAIGSPYRAGLSKITRRIAAGPVRPTTVTIGRHQTHGGADTGESQTPGAVRCNFGNKHADEWVRWQGGLERRGQRRGMSGDQGSENKRHSEALCTMINTLIT